MPSCPFVPQIHQSKGQKVPKSGAFKNEGIHEIAEASLSPKATTPIIAAALKANLICFIICPSLFVGFVGPNLTSS
jgi:hypothetical protein